MAQTDVIDLVSEVGQICRQCPTSVLVNAYVDAVRRFCIQTRWLTGSSAMLTSVDEDAYVIGTNPYNDIVGITAISFSVSSTEAYDLRQVSSVNWDPNRENGAPCEYQYIPEAQFVVYPTPDAEYGMDVGIVMAPRRGATSIDSALPIRWEYTFRKGALAYLLSLPNVPWANQAEADRQRQLFEADIYSATSSVSRGYNVGIQQSNGESTEAMRTNLLLF